MNLDTHRVSKMGVFSVLEIWRVKTILSTLCLASLNGGRTWASDYLSITPSNNSLFQCCIKLSDDARREILAPIASLKNSLQILAKERKSSMHRWIQCSKLFNSTTTDDNEFQFIVNIMIAVKMKQNYSLSHFFSIFTCFKLKKIPYYRHWSSGPPPWLV